MTDTAISAWSETLKVLEEAEAVTELKARLVGLHDAFKEGGESRAIEAARILSFLDEPQPGAFADVPAIVLDELRKALARMAASDPAAKEPLSQL